MREYLLAWRNVYHNIEHEAIIINRRTLFPFAQYGVAGAVAGAVAESETFAFHVHYKFVSSDR